MKKKTFALILIATLLFGTAAYAAVSTYISSINAHKESEKSRLQNLYNQKLNEYGSRVDSDLSAFTNTEKNRITSEMNAYVDAIAKAAVEASVEDDKAAITRAANDAITELKQYVDNLK